MFSLITVFITEPFSRDVFFFQAGWHWPGAGDGCQSSWSAQHLPGDGECTGLVLILYISWRETWSLNEIQLWGWTLKLKEFIKAHLGGEVGCIKQILNLLKVHKARWVGGSKHIFKSKSFLLLPLQTLANLSRVGNTEEYTVFGKESQAKSSLRLFAATLWFQTQGNGSVQTLLISDAGCDKFTPRDQT